MTDEEKKVYLYDVGRRKDKLGGTEGRKLIRRMEKCK